MSSQEVIENKISFIEREVSSARKSYAARSQDDIKNDKLLRGALERNLYVIAQAVIDLAEALIAYKGLRKPTTMREAFDILAENDILPADFAGRFSKIVGFRNILAHGYEDVDVAVLYEVLQNRLGEVEEFLDYIKERLL